MEIPNKEEVKGLSKFFFNKILDEFNDGLNNGGFADFLNKKLSSVPNEKKEVVYSGIILNTIFAVEYTFKIDNSEKGLKNIEDIIKKLKNKKSETDKMFSSVIETEIGLSEENCLAIFATDCFCSFICLLEMETKLNLGGTMSKMLSGLMFSFFETHDLVIIKTFEELPAFLRFLLKHTTEN